MDERATLDALIANLENKLGIPPCKENAPRTTSTDRSPREILDGLIEKLENKIGIGPDQPLPWSTVGSRAAGTGQGASLTAKICEDEGKGNMEGSGKTKIERKKKQGKKGGAAPNSGGGDKGAPSQSQPVGTKIDLRVGVITKVWPHESANRLFCEEIDVGEGEPRLIASGLVGHYTLEDMLGRRLIVMCNLKTSVEVYHVDLGMCLRCPCSHDLNSLQPRNLKGFKSKGMVVCATGVGDQEGIVELLEPPEGAEVGEKLFFDGLPGGPFEPVPPAQMEKQKVLETVMPDFFTDDSGVAVWQGYPLVSANGPCKARTITNGMVH